MGFEHRFQAVLYTHRVLRMAEMKGRQGKEESRGLLFSHQNGRSMAVGYSCGERMACHAYCKQRCHS